MLFIGTQFSNLYTASWKSNSKGSVRRDKRQREREREEVEACAGEGEGEGKEELRTRGMSLQ